MEVKYFKVKHKVLKASLHGQIWSDFEKVSLKMLSVIFGKNQNHKSQFSDEFCSVAPSRARFF
jgi:AAA+ superfamily predicted ATPase